MKKKSIELKNRQISPKPGSALQTQVDEDVINENLPTFMQTDNKQEHSSHRLLTDNSAVAQHRLLSDNSAVVAQEEEQGTYEAPASLTDALGTIPHEIYLPSTAKNE